MTNICQSIQCPYFSNNLKTSWGCQRYTVALQCHLLGKGKRPELEKSSTQYALHGDGYNIAELKQENEAFFLSNPRYLDDLALKEDDFLSPDDPPFPISRSVPMAIHQDGTVDWVDATRFGDSISR